MAKEISLAERLVNFWRHYDPYGFEDAFDDTESAVATFEEGLNDDPDEIIYELKNEIENFIDPEDKVTLSKVKILIGEIERYKNERN